MFNVKKTLLDAEILVDLYMNDPFSKTSGLRKFYDLCLRNSIFIEKDNRIYVSKRGMKIYRSNLKKGKNNE